MKNLLNKLLIFFLLPVLLYSCVNSDYDMDNIDDSGGLSPALALPVGTLKTGIMDFIKKAGIETPLQGTNTDTIYVAYNGSMSLTPLQEIPGLSGNSPFYIPPGVPIDFVFDGGVASVDIDVFKNLESSGSVLHPSNPKVFLTIHNYIGAGIDINVNGITSYGGSRRVSATFSNNETSYVINVASAPEPHRYAVTNVSFDKANGKMHELFAISPERIAYDFSVNLNVTDGSSHFLVTDKFVDIDYEVKIPFTFSNGTQLASADTLTFDLSGEDFINSLDELKLWIDYENRLRTTVDLEILFLDEYKEPIQEMNKKVFHMKAAPVAEGVNQRDAMPAKDSFETGFDKNEIDNAKKTRYIILKSVFKVDANEVNIHPSDYVNLKLSAYLKINI